MSSALSIVALPLAIIAFAALVAWAWQTPSAATRPCPRCGRRVTVGKLDCDCGFDFREVGRS